MKGIKVSHWRGPAETERVRLESVAEVHKEHKRLIRLRRQLAMTEQRIAWYERVIRATSNEEKN